MKAVGWLVLGAALFLACTGDDEIYAVPKDAGSFDAASATSSGGAASSSSSGSVAQDGASNDGAANDGGDASTEGGVTDGGADAGSDSGPVVCAVVTCSGNATCTAVGCGSCNLGLGFCQP